MKEWWDDIRHKLFLFLFPNRIPGTVVYGWGKFTLGCLFPIKMLNYYLHKLPLPFMYDAEKDAIRVNGCWFSLSALKCFTIPNEEKWFRIVKIEECGNIHVQSKILNMENIEDVKNITKIFIEAKNVDIETDGTTRNGDIKIDGKLLHCHTSLLLDGRDCDNNRFVVILRIEPTAISEMTNGKVQSKPL
jgi:hypothetical protein